jgi:hypothetical protein
MSGSRRSDLKASLLDNEADSAANLGDSEYQEPSDSAITTPKRDLQQKNALNKKKKASSCKFRPEVKEKAIDTITPSLRKTLTLTQR